MANAVKWEAAFLSRGDVLTTELNALANAARTAAGAVIDNATNLDQYGKLELTVDFVSAPSAGAVVNVYMVTAPNGTNYEDGSGTVDPGAHTLVAVIPIRVDTAAQRLTSRLFTMQPALSKFILENLTGQAFPASGSILKLYVTNEEIQ
jgi:hypothetical protein